MSIHPNFTKAWTNTLDDIIVRGIDSDPRGMGTRELLFQQIVVTDPLSFPLSEDVRQFRDVIGYLEGLSLVGQCSIPETFTQRVKKFSQFTDGGIFHGAYANRVAGSLVDLVNLLKRDPDSRQAVLSIYDSGRDLDRQKRDIPCTIAVQFLLRERKLNIRVMMRSNDVWLGMPYDFMQFAILQAAIAQALHVNPGQYVHEVGSLHLYDRDMSKVADLTIERGLQENLAMYYRQDFPLFSADDDIASISARARELLLNPNLIPETMFESFVTGALDE